jgi:CspA family cold shock protein
LTITATGDYTHDPAAFSARQGSAKFRKVYPPKGIPAFRQIQNKKEESMSAAKIMSEPEATAVPPTVPSAAPTKTIKATGTVKLFDDAKGYGFISQANGGEDLFVHFTAISTDGYKTLREGQDVEFTVSGGQKGPLAENVVPKE